MGKTIEIYKKAQKFMNESLDKYNSGNVAEAKTLRRKANKLFDLYESRANTKENKRDMLYGDNRNFGIMYHVFENNLNRLFNTSRGKDAIGSIAKMIRENKILKTQFNIYNNIKNTTINEAKGYADKVISTMPHLKRKEVKEANDKLLDTFERVGINETVYIPDADVDLYEAVEYIMFNKPTLTNMNDYDECRKVLDEHVEHVIESRDTYNATKAFEEKLEAMQETIDKELNDDERELIEAMSKSPEESERIFTQNKKKLQNKLNETISSADKDSKDSWKAILEKINKKTFSEATALKDTAEMIEIYNTL